MRQLLKRIKCVLRGWHLFYLDDLKRVDDETVTGICHCCGAKYAAACGLDLPGILDGYRRDADRPSLSQVKS